ncbi:unnamed protein product [Paramecium pentaurelia]|uniref:Uncharacterized protein n=1 Tax=Paramecium pentaurelia TaxID=43138 RepID=A0A8S1S473_9CILI|nr:unnamed protein product [Paramecium pentaurelia]
MIEETFKGSRFSSSLLNSQEVNLMINLDIPVFSIFRKIYQKKTIKLSNSVVFCFPLQSLNFSLIPYINYFISIKLNKLRVIIFSCADLRYRQARKILLLEVGTVFVRKQEQNKSLFQFYWLEI